MYFKKVAFAFIAAMGAGQGAHAALVEDGSQFTGTYRALEPACFTPASLDAAGNPVPEKSEFGFNASPAAFQDDQGNTFQIQPFDVFDHGEGSLTGQTAQYLSEREFMGQTFIVSGSQFKLTRESYTLDRHGILTHTSLVKTDEGAFKEVRRCRFKAVD